MGYNLLADPPRGEVIIRGPIAFHGYYKVGPDTVGEGLLPSSRGQRVGRFQLHGAGALRGEGAPSSGSDRRCWCKGDPA